MPRRWEIDPLVRCRRLDNQLLAYHCGSGDTHLLTPFSGAVLTALAVGDGETAPSLEDVRADPGIARFGVGDGQIADALWMLEEAGIVRTAGSA
ncbi:MAG: HPr-rel-A system PqqD family peptide chaperone [Halofilum sp. (in: g-proteobacteria)]